MFGFSLATQILQGSTQRTWNYLSNFGSLVWSKFVHLRWNTMPRSRKRHHSHSKSRSRSHSRDRSSERHKKNDSHEKDGKRRKIDSLDSPYKRSLSQNRSESFEDVAKDEMEQSNEIEDIKISEDAETVKQDVDQSADKDVEETVLADKDVKIKSSTDDYCENDNNSIIDDAREIVVLSDTETDNADSRDTQKEEKPSTPSRQPLTPRQIQRKLESEKKRQLKQKERDDKLKQKEEERNRLKEEKLKQKQQKEAEKLKQLEEKQRILEQKQKDKELKEEQKRKEKEEKELKRKEKEEQKRKERELERLKKQQEVEEKNKEKQKEEEKKQKTAALFVNFFKKTDMQQDDKKIEKPNTQFMPFEVKSDMRLPPSRRNPLSEKDVSNLDNLIQNQNETASYLSDLKAGNRTPRKCSRTWPKEDLDDDITIIEEEKKLGETICEDAPKHQRLRTKFLYFHENKRPPYYGTWRKKSKSINPRRPLSEDTDIFNYEEDSDDDWEEEEQGESLDVSDDEADKETEEEKDDYEVDNEFFVPHGHLSDDEIDDEENARLSPESLKQKLKLLKDEFEADIHSKTRKLKPRSIGCVWYNKEGDNVETAIQKYLQPFAIIVKGQIEIKKRSEIFCTPPEKKKVKITREFTPEQISSFLAFIDGNTNKKKILIEQFLTHMINSGINIEVPKVYLLRFLKQAATYKKCKDNGPMKNKFVWTINDDLKKKYNIVSEKSK